MNDTPVLVRSSMKTWDSIAVVVVGVALFVGGWIISQQGMRPGGIALEVMGALLAVAAGYGLQQRINKRMWVRDEGDGFTVIDKSGERAYADREVSSIAISTKVNYSEGNAQSVTRKLFVWIAGKGEAPDEKHLFENTINMGGTDPLNDFLNRLCKQAHETAKADLASGRNVSGDGWTLTANELQLTTGKTQDAIRLDDIVDSSIVDDKLTVWKQGQDEPWAKLPIDTVNAYVLKWIVEERVAARGEQPEPAPVEGSLGRVLFERKAHPSHFPIFVTLTVLLFLATIGFGIGGIVSNDADRGVLFLVAGLCLLIGIACALGAMHARRLLFRCHQYGLIKRGLGREQLLRYEHVLSFTYQATRHFHNGVYTGTVFNLIFDPVPEHKANKITYNITLQNSDDEIDNLRDQIAGILGARMRQRVMAGETVVWTPVASFQGQKLVYREAGFFGKKAPVEFKLPDIVSYNLHQGVCYLFKAGDTKPCIQTDMHATNFYPGFFCLLALIGENLPKSEEASSDPTVVEEEQAES